MRGKEGYALNGGRGALAVIGRDYGRNEERRGEPFVGRAGRLLDSCLKEAGLRRSRLNILNCVNRQPPGNQFEAHRRGDVEEGIRLLHETLSELQPKLIICLGNEASHAVVPEWPDARFKNGNGRSELTHVGDIFGARGIEKRRGYLWETPFGPALTTVHPSYASRQWKPFRTLLQFDLARAKEVHRNDLDDNGHLLRPRREVEIVTRDRAARSAVAALRSDAYLAADIETYPDGSLACVGFAGRSGKAFVFPAERIADAGELLEDPDVDLVWANGVYDLFCLKHREGINVRGEQHDVQLMWHSYAPELAGKDDTARNKMTRKSLAFLASLCTLDPYWKGDYETEEEFFEYNGKDCCVTFDVAEWLRPRLERKGAMTTYERSRRLMWPCVDSALARGLRVDESLRRRRLRKLEERRSDLHERLNALALPILRREAENGVETRLFENVEGVCECCRHGEAKQQRCWGCAGLPSGYVKADLVDLAERRGVDAEGKTVAELEAELLSTCEVCEGKARREWLEWNPNSGEQTKVLLYDALKLPKRTKHGRLTSDESALKSLLGVVSS